MASVFLTLLFLANPAQHSTTHVIKIISDSSINQADYTNDEFLRIVTQGRVDLPPEPPSEMRPNELHPPKKMRLLRVEPGFRGSRYGYYLFNPVRSHYKPIDF